MKQPIVIIGIGELAGVFAHGFLKCGYPVYPVARGVNFAEECQHISAPKLVLVTVQESELHSVLEQMPEAWRDKVGLVQNELLPRDWQTHQIINPTVTVVWFEKKKTMGLTNILQSPSFGPNASAVSDALQALDIPAPILENEQDLLYELVRKALYILTVNVAGLVNNCTVGDLWEGDQLLAREVAAEVILIEESLTGKSLPREKLINGMVEGIKDCPDRHCLGRSAESRLKQALEYAKEANLNTPKLIEIFRSVSPYS